MEARQIQHFFAIPVCVANPLIGGRIYLRAHVTDMPCEGFRVHLEQTRSRLIKDPIFRLSNA